MSLLRFTLVTEGSSDRALIPILIWAIQQNSDVDIQPRWAELRRLPDPPKSLVDKIRVSLQLFPCDLLFVHRDADRWDRESRVREIGAAMNELEDSTHPPPVCVVPVRALEAWFLFDEPAIRRASGNPNGTTPLELPPLRTVEELSEPKTRLRETVRRASELEGRRRRRIQTSKALHRIADLVSDFSPLRELSAFTAFEDDLQRSLASLVR